MLLPVVKNVIVQIGLLDLNTKIVVVVKVWKIGSEIEGKHTGVTSH